MKIRFIKKGDKTPEEYEAAIKALKDEFRDYRISSLDRFIEDDHKIEDLTKQLKDLQMEIKQGFPLTEKEYIAVNRWMEDHSHTKHNGACGCGGGSYSFVFVPTGLGTAGYVSCTCGDEFVFREIE